MESIKQIIDTEVVIFNGVTEYEPYPDIRGDWRIFK